MNKIFIFVIPSLLSADFSLLRVALCQGHVRCGAGAIKLCIRNPIVFNILPLISQRRKKNKHHLAYFSHLALTRVWLEGKRQHPRRSIRLLSGWRTQRFERGRMWAQSLKATLSRKREKSKIFWSKNPRTWLGQGASCAEAAQVSQRSVLLLLRWNWKGIATRSSTKAQLCQVYWLKHCATAKTKLRFRHWQYK